MNDIAHLLKSTSAPIQERAPARWLVVQTDIGQAIVWFTAHRLQVRTCMLLISAQLRDGPADISQDLSIVVNLSFQLRKANPCCVIHWYVSICLSIFMFIY